MLAQPHDNVLINLHDTTPTFFSRFERLIEIVSLDSTDQDAARLRWRFYNLSEQGEARKEPAETVEQRAKKIYESWFYLNGYVPWVEHGNSLIQDEARKLATTERKHRADQT